MSPSERRRDVLQRPALFLFLLSYELWFGWDRVRFRFAPDDMMNMGFYFPGGPWKAILSQALLWQYHYRPMGAAFYLPLHHWFGLNPAPYQATVLVLLAINMFLVFGLARMLGAGDLVAGIAALVVSYHAGLGDLVYNVDMIYDVLCFLFYAGALLLYTWVRRQGRLLSGWETAAFLVLFVLALNSKEMAPTLPLVLIAYELFYHSPKRSRAALRTWLTGPCRIAWIAALLNVVYLYGKIFGADTILKNEAYQPVFTWQRLVDFQLGSLYDLMGHFWKPQGGGVLLVWVVITYLAWRGNRPILRFCWAYMVLTPIPIEFLAGRFQGCLYIPLAGWAIFGAVVFADFVEGVARFAGRTPRFVTAVLLVIGVFLWGRQMLRVKRHEILPAATNMGLVTADVIQQLNMLNPHVKPGGKIIFLNDPFDAWDMSFIATLWFRDPSLQVFLQQKDPQSPAEIAKMDAVFDFRAGKLTLAQTSVPGFYGR